MKAHVGVDDLIKVIVFYILINFYENPFQMFQLVGRNPFGCQTGRKFFQGTADFKNLYDVLQGNIGHIGSPARYHDDEAFKFELADCFAYRCPAYAQFVSQADFHEPFSRFKDPILNRLAQGLTDDFP